MTKFVLNFLLKECFHLTDAHHGVANEDCASVFYGSQNIL